MKILDNIDRYLENTMNEVVTKQDFIAAAKYIKAQRKAEPSLRAVLSSKPAVVTLITSLLSQFNPGTFDKEKFLRIAGLKGEEEEEEGGE